MCVVVEGVRPSSAIFTVETVADSALGMYVILLCVLNCVSVVYRNA